MASKLRATERNKMADELQSQYAAKRQEQFLLRNHRAKTTSSTTG